MGCLLPPPSAPSLQLAGRAAIAVCISLAPLGSLTGQNQRPTAFQEEKARALLRTQLPCLGCHELDGEGARGGAPSLTDIGRRRNAAYISAIVDDPQRVVPGSGMPKTPMLPATRDVIVRYLARDAVPGPAPAPSTERAVDRTPQALYMRWCMQCHGHNGSGDGPNAKYLPVPPAVHHDPATMGARSDDQLYDVIAAGGRASGKSPRMPAFGGTLSDAEIRALVALIRAKCGCEGPAWSRRARP